MDYSVKAAAQLSAHLKSLRKSLGLTQAQLGQRIGVKQVRIAEIEKDPGAISVDQLIALLGALGVEVVLSDRQAGADDPALAPAATRSARPGRGQW